MPEDKEMGIWDHINELRQRLFKAVLALIVGSVISFIFAQKLLDILAVPIGGLQNLIAIEVTENVSVFFRVSLLAGFILAFPVIFYQLLAYIIPGLTPEETKSLIIFIPFATILFIGGVAFAYFVMMPSAIPFLVSFLGVQTKPRISNYIEFVTNLIFWIGVTFELPLVSFALAKFKVVNASMLIKQWRFAIVIIALIAALVTPTPDPINMGILMVPLAGIYLLSILMAWIARGKN
jgi:sec-independent protein translocase protein TatC